MTETEAQWEDEGGAVLPELDEAVEGELVPEDTDAEVAVESPEDEPVTITAEVVLQQLRDKYLNTPTRVAEQLAQDIINPIELARVLGIRPQQVYQAIRHGALTAVKQNNTQKLYIELDEASRWSAQYLNRKLQRAANAQKAETQVVEEAS